MSGQRTRRDWGWHPLRPDWARRVVAESPVAAGDLVLDIGAGHGALTGPLADAGARVIAVELHPGRAAALRERYAERGVRVVRCDLRDLRLPSRPFRVVASPPYSLSTPLVRLLLGTDRLLSADLVLQSATARRIAAAPPRARHARRYRLRVGRAVPRAAFRPPPRVDSVVLRVER
ncbi:rRNA adenine N-6-methyltransferase family protein [Nocardioides sp. BYT-33-1]|uniref:rRNA adenine N-6-methyltransferase family protein n=1 Tax=Nocardioides sp. BYT-33-1 TaxID=3416952 RepID=UPI003F53BAF2